MTQVTIDQAMQTAIADHKAGRFAEAEIVYRQILTQQPDHAHALHLLGLIASEAGQLDAAIDLIQQAIRIKPDYLEAHYNLGNALRARGLLDEAVAAYRQGIRLKPDFTEAHNNLGNILGDKGLLDEAIAPLRQAIRLKPDFVEAHNNLGNALRDKGLLDDAMASYRQAIRLKPDYADAYSNLLLALNFDPLHDPQSILAEHRAWSDRYALPLASQITPHANDRSNGRRLRIGYISNGLCRHSVAYFLMPLLKNHDPAGFQIVAYSNVLHPDAMTERMKLSCSAWHNIVGLDDDVVAKLIRSHGIDILVDLNGHTGGNRLLVLARKPVPVQVTYLGYPNTTGMPAIDYRLTDALADPPAMTDLLNVEKLWRLPQCAWCYQASENAPEIQTRPDGPITFGCFNAFAKVTPQMLDLWADLLHHVPGSRLLLKSAGAGQASAQLRLREQFARHGIPGERLEMLGWTHDPRHHSELYSQVDVALDTYPYHGTTTTCEALWMGVPVVSLAGRTHVSRVGVSLLTHIGLSELIAQTPEQYVQIAAGLANDPKRLEHLRSTLRQRMQSSPLMDGPGFARDVESAYRRMWEIWCAAQA